MNIAATKMKVQCMWCGLAAYAAVQHRVWYQLPPGWFIFVQPGNDSFQELRACSTACIEARDRATAMKDEFRLLYEEEFGNTRRNDQEPERTAREAADRRFVQKYGADWWKLVTPPVEAQT